MGTRKGGVDAGIDGALVVVARCPPPVVKETAVVVPVRYISFDSKLIVALRLPRRSQPSITSC
jgi:hypothetical protein